MATPIKDESGQAVVEAAVGFVVIATVIAFIFGALFLSWTRFLVESANDSLNICTVESRVSTACEREARDHLKRVAPWLSRTRITSHYSFSASGFLKCDSEISAQILLEGKWDPQFRSRRQYCERMVKTVKKVSSSPARCS